LLVRLDPDEMDYSDGSSVAKGYVDKTPDGNCIHFDTETKLCRIWKNRPRVCREYECNSDFLLQVAVRKGFTSIGKLAKDSLKIFVPKETYIRIPLLEDVDNGK
jgi:hypothetical protein